MQDQAKDGDAVRVHYTGRLEGGDVFDTSEDGEPLEFQIGQGQVIAGFERGVVGMNVGDKKVIEIEIDDAYGERIDALVRTIERSGMNLDVEPQAGMNLIMQLADGNQIPVAITEVTETHVTLDANHPLAGQRLIFDLERVS
ncbi:MAG: peptidylprolyl isomerase [Pyrinomonadaceae bacterium]|nr:peptidylprolyl isomerase [Pyrinomonadaceae bacterium]